MSLFWVVTQYGFAGRDINILGNSVSTSALKVKTVGFSKTWIYIVPTGSYWVTIQKNMTISPQEEPNISAFVVV
jgi:hypothetical protein